MHMCQKKWNKRNKNEKVKLILSGGQLNVVFPFPRKCSLKQ